MLVCVCEKVYEYVGVARVCVCVCECHDTGVC